MDFVHRMPRTPGAPLTGIELASIKGAVRGAWGREPPRHPRRILLPNVPPGELLTLVAALCDEPALADCRVQMVSTPAGPVITLDVRWPTRARSSKARP